MPEVHSALSVVCVSVSTARTRGERCVQQERGRASCCLAQREDDEEVDGLVCGVAESRSAHREKGLSSVRRPRSLGCARVRCMLVLQVLIWMCR